MVTQELFSSRKDQVVRKGIPREFNFKYFSRKYENFD